MLTSDCQACFNESDPFLLKELSAAPQIAKFDPNIAISGVRTPEIRFSRPTFAWHANRSQTESRAAPFGASGRQERPLARSIHKGPNEHVRAMRQDSAGPVTGEPIEGKRTLFLTPII